MGSRGLEMPVEWGFLAGPFPRPLDSLPQEFTGRANSLAYWYYSLGHCWTVAMNTEHRNER
jgi:hypothetical protein